MAPAIKLKPRKKPLQERSMATVRLLLDATARILAKEGYERATTNRIAAVAGVSIGSLYQYYPNKEAIVADLLARTIQNDLQKIDVLIQESKGMPLHVAWQHFLETLLAHYEKDGGLRRVFIQQCPRIGKGETLESFKISVTEKLQADLALRQIGTSERERLTIAYLITHAIDGVIRAALWEAPGVLSRKELVAGATRMIVRLLHL